MDVLIRARSAKQVAAHRAQIKREAKKPITEKDVRWREGRRLDDLVRRTAHIAPYFTGSGFREEGRYRDAVAVVRAYLRGEVMTLDGALLRRLARDEYSRSPWSRVSAQVPAR